jgi:RNA ligase (TIGR02306 family)
MTDITRKMATIRRIDKIEPIPDADKIVKATVGGWQLVTAIANGFKEGDLVVYLEIDSWVPTSVASFLTKPGHTPKVFNGVEGEKLRSIKLRGTVSQGLLLPLDILTMVESELIEDLDVTVPLGIQKYEKPIDASLAGLVKGNFPAQIPKTDQERIQNLKRELQTEFHSMFWEVTEKLEGSSMTTYIIDGEFGVCSRNLDLKRDENNTFWKVAIESGIEEKLRSLDIDIALQGELIGPGIQDNIYGLTKHEFRVFEAIDIKTRACYTPAERIRLCQLLNVSIAPVIKFEMLLGDIDMERLIKFADGPSALNDKTAREGVVLKSMDGKRSFKVISNAYLVKQKD